MKFISFYVYLVLVQSQNGAIIDETMQNLRLNYGKFKASSLKSVDRSFFNTYNALYNSFFGANKNFDDDDDGLNWNKMCKNIQMSQFSNETINLLQKVCFHGRGLIDKIHEERENGLILMYPGEQLRSTTNPGRSAEFIFDIIELQLNEVWRIYNKNQSCVGQFIGNFLPSYELVIQNVIFLSNQTIEHLSNTFSEARLETEQTRQIMMRCVYYMGSCLAKDDFDSCVRRWVSQNKISCQ